ncbi:hypothetical protein AAHY02_24075 [Klebsiella variicola subsp. variicola]|uniref:hypothetical protein n=1 Tax=Klebsiella variicola TaxID=244366 RepID=UPI0035A3A69A|nr:hypothetical protein [Klebsiella pneumoniae]HBR4708018.1 hypothetical protein [Klebsiella pneumoniae]
MKISTSYLWASDIVAYAADPINFDEVVKVNALASEIVAGSLLDKTTLTLANDATTAENLILVLDPAWAGQKYLRICRNGLATFVRRENLVAASGADMENLFNKLAENLIVIAGDEKMLPTT